MDRTVSKAIILAAGFGSRLYPITETKPKPLTPVGDQSIIHRLIANLEGVGINDIVIVKGHLGDSLSTLLPVEFPDTRFTFLHNQDFDKTNNIYSLWLAKDHFEEDFLLLEADVISNTECLDLLSRRPFGSSAALVSPKAYYMDGACVELAGNPVRITAPKQVPDKEIGPQHYKTVNFYRISGQFATGWLKSRLQAKVDKGDLSGYYETAFAEAIDSGVEIFEAAIVSEADWFEVDNLNDLDIAEFQLMDAEQRLKHLSSRHGGYWRYPIKDFCLLYNFHYPPRKLLAHISARLEQLVREYPSSQKQITDFLSQYYGIDPSLVVTANGVSELIPIVLEGISEPVIIPTPSFNEYEAVVPKALLNQFQLREDEGFTVDPDRLLSEIEEVKAKHLVLITPNNPTGNAIGEAALHKILSGARELGCQVIVDESFVDFQTNGRSESLMNHLLRYPNLAVLLSLSKSHGIGGIRLGMLASADADLIARVRARTPIWNINALAEEYIRLYSSFRKEYKVSCELVRQETDQLADDLNKIDGIKAYPSDANFVFCKIDREYGSARGLTLRLLNDHSIYIKDCSGKTMPDADLFFRVASRGRADNSELASAINSVLRSTEKIVNKMITVQYAQSL
ncbi:aminotransferase class I/II-fold pyridoxal phosphate-dependent enzyme [Agrobacterium vitis]|uniref:aminotransferase class I/II-fold pyridoxal phosphate-dependent enzyme n=1 Tax=Agrobacterium vitis TaxID=373 RepID=UPI001F2F98EE|nr:aminotransferase class I/II-fold pyridoxal phosphate-dependent enzyme [Agrobacterium vitis]MCF1470223.1 aminotransferase class I/II-fold pyridoxal phosphate-dependent enzyme [Agrobacterium vitis]